MTYGYHGNYLLIDLSAQTVTKVALSSDILKKYIGGVGLASYILMKETEAGYDPLEEKAPIVFSTSPLVGTPLTTSAKFSIVAKSPLTGRICDAMCSSQFAVMAKKLGTDAICFKGKLNSKSILFIEQNVNDCISLNMHHANEFRGLSASATEALIKSQFGKKWSVSSIGPAGEKLIPFATISHDGRHAGRGGLGAVLGSKNLKAIAIYGEKNFQVANHRKTIEIAKNLSHRSFGPETSKYRELGTISNLLVFNRLNALPVRNFQESHLADAQNLTPHLDGPAKRISKNSCNSCTIGCEHLFELETTSHSKSTRLEYESLFAIGPLCGITDAPKVLQIARLCDEIGIDTITTGGTIAFLMQCTENHLINFHLNYGQLSLEFGNSDAVLHIVNDIISETPEAMTQLLKLGSRRAAQAIGQNSISFACQVKGLEMPGYHPARLHAMALGMAVGTRGADHNRSGAYEIDFSNHSQDAIKIAQSVAAKEDHAAVMDSLILCKFLRGIFTDFYEEASVMLQAVTGFQLSPDSLKQSGEEIVMLRRAFNQREGWQPQEDFLPDSIYQSNINDFQKLTIDRFEEMKNAYYAIRNLTDDGFLDQKRYLQLIIQAPKIS